MVVYRRYMVVYRRIVGKKSVSTTVFLSSFWHYDIIRYPRRTFHFIRQYFTRKDVKVMRTRHYTNCAIRLEKLKLSDVDRPFLGISSLRSVVRTLLYRWR